MPREPAASFSGGSAGMRDVLGAEPAASFSGGSAGMADFVEHFAC